MKIKIIMYFFWLNIGIHCVLDREINPQDIKKGIMICGFNPA